MFSCPGSFADCFISSIFCRGQIEGKEVVPKLLVVSGALVFVDRASAVGKGFKAAL